MLKQRTLVGFLILPLFLSWDKVKEALKKNKNHLELGGKNSFYVVDYESAYVYAYVYA